MIPSIPSIPSIRAGGISGSIKRVPLFANGQQVFVNGKPVMVPLQFANA